MPSAKRESDGPLSYAEMIAVGLSPRRLEWWTRLGLLRTDAVSPGSGHHRRWLAGEDVIARRMLRFVNAGLSPDAAELAARGEPLAPGIALEVDGKLAPYGEGDIKRAIQALMCRDFYGANILDESTLGEMAAIVLSVYHDQHRS